VAVLETVDKIVSYVDEVEFNRIFLTINTSLICYRKEDYLIVDKPRPTTTTSTTTTSTSTTSTTTTSTSTTTTTTEKTTTTVYVYKPHLRKRPKIVWF
jgi:hypothetical protein